MSAAAVAPEPGDSIPRGLLLILRVHLGVILLLTVAGKLLRDQPFSVEMLAYLQGFSLRVAAVPYQHFITGVVVPHAALFSYLVMIGELTAGIGLLTGTATRLAALIAMLLFLNYMLSKGRIFWSPDSEDAAVFMSALVVFLGRAGRSFGVDRWLARRWPGGPLW